jgi:ribosomal protein L31
MKLVPCKRCGSKRIIVFNYYGFWQAQCRSCGTYMKRKSTEKEAIELWNKKHSKKKERINTCARIYNDYKCWNTSRCCDFLNNQFRCPIFKQKGV